MWCAKSLKKIYQNRFFKAGTFRKSIIFFALDISLRTYKADNYLVPGERIGHIYTKYIYA
jgi:hypothetical protein